MAEQKSCSYAGFKYSHRAKICKSGECMLCKDGRWESTGKKCPC